MGTQNKIVKQSYRSCILTHKLLTTALKVCKKTAWWWYNIPKLVAHFNTQILIVVFWLDCSIFQYYALPFLSMLRSMVLWPCYAVPFCGHVTLCRFVSMLCCVVSCPCYAVSFHVHVMLYLVTSMLCCNVLCPCYAVSVYVHAMLYLVMSLLRCAVLCPC